MRRLTSFLYRNKGFIAFMLCMVMFRSALADWSVVPTGSMQPTIQIGDRIFIDKAAYDIRLPLTHVSLLHLADPSRGDIVVLDSHAADERLVKRVIGIPGDEVAMRANVLYINGVAARYTPMSVQGIHDDRLDPARYAVEQVDGMRHLVRLSIYRQPRQQRGLPLPGLLPAQRNRGALALRRAVAGSGQPLPAARNALRRPAGRQRRGRPLNRALPVVRAAFSTYHVRLAWTTRTVSERWQSGRMYLTRNQAYV